MGTNLCTYNSSSEGPEETGNWGLGASTSALLTLLMVEPAAARTRGAGVGHSSSIKIDSNLNGYRSVRLPMVIRFYGEEKRPRIV